MRRVRHANSRTWRGADAKRSRRTYSASRSAQRGSFSLRRSIACSSDCSRKPGHASVSERLVWMDLEMTGLDPERHVIVSLALLITELDDYTPLVERELVVHQPDSA